MAEKDASEKILESYNDVFSDIVNVLLFNGKQVLGADEFIFPLAFSKIRDIILRQSFPRPLAGVADIEGCDGHIHL